MEIIAGCHYCPFNSQDEGAPDSTCHHSESPENNDLWRIGTGEVPRWCPLLKSPLTLKLSDAITIKE